MNESPAQVNIKGHRDLYRLEKPQHILMDSSPWNPTNMAARVAQTFTPHGPHEMAVAANDSITILFEQDGWAYAVHNHLQTEGYIPLTFCDIVNASVTMANSKHGSFEETNSMNVSFNAWPSSDSSLVNMTADENMATCMTNGTPCVEDFHPTVTEPALRSQQEHPNVEAPTECTDTQKLDHGPILRYQKTAQKPTMASTIDAKSESNVCKATSPDASTQTFIPLTTSSMPSAAHSFADESQSFLSPSMENSRETDYLKVLRYLTRSPSEGIPPPPSFMDPESPSASNGLLSCSPFNDLESGLGDMDSLLECPDARAFSPSNDEDQLVVPMQMRRQLQPVSKGTQTSAPSSPLCHSRHGHFSQQSDDTFQFLFCAREGKPLRETCANSNNSFLKIPEKIYKPDRCGSEDIMLDPICVLTTDDEAENDGHESLNDNDFSLDFDRLKMHDAVRLQEPNCSDKKVESDGIPVPFFSNEPFQSAAEQNKVLPSVTSSCQTRSCSTPMMNDSLNRLNSSLSSIPSQSSCTHAALASSMHSVASACAPAETPHYLGRPSHLHEPSYGLYREMPSFHLSTTSTPDTSRCSSPGSFSGRSTNAHEAGGRQRLPLASRDYRASVCSSVRSSCAGSEYDVCHKRSESITEGGECSCQLTTGKTEHQEHGLTASQNNVEITPNIELPFTASDRTSRTHSETSSLSDTSRVSRLQVLDKIRADFLALEEKRLELKARAVRRSSSGTRVKGSNPASHEDYITGGEVVRRKSMRATRSKSVSRCVSFAESVKSDVYVDEYSRLRSTDSILCGDERRVRVGRSQSVRIGRQSRRTISTRLALDQELNTKHMYADNSEPTLLLDSAGRAEYSSSCHRSTGRPTIIATGVSTSSTGVISPSFPERQETAV